MGDLSILILIACVFGLVLVAWHSIQLNTKRIKEIDRHTQKMFELHFKYIQIVESKFNNHRKNSETKQASN